jgi:para-nitrobenzyl esterase
VQTYWTQFAKTGNPNGPGVPTWPAYDGTARHFLNVTASAGIEVADDPRGPVCDLFRELMGRPAAAP